MYIYKDLGTTLHPLNVICTHNIKMYKNRFNDDILIFIQDNLIYQKYKINISVILCIKLMIGVIDCHELDFENDITNMI